VIPFRTGNLSVRQLHAARHGEPAPDPREERELLPHWRALGFDAVEDYVAWQVVEPRPGEWDFALHRGHAQAAARAGLQYVVYPWVHSLPPWWRAGPECVLARCVEHGQQGALPSLWAESTWHAAERLWRALAAALRDEIRGVAIAFPADYGEVACGSGVADWILGEHEHQHVGLWCDEAPARAAWRAAVRARHGTPAALGTAWALPADDAWERAPLPAHDAALAHRADFARFLRGGVQDGARRLLSLARELFPDVPREIKLGHCSEALELGSDWHALVDLAARHGAGVRFTGAAQGELFTRRVASLCRTHGAPLLTEAPREIPVWLLHERAFTDVAAGARDVFEFPEQLVAARAGFEAVRPALGQTPLRPQVGCLYATTDLPLQPGRGAPEALVHAWPALRRVCDLDPLDERQIARGALAGLAGLLVLDGEHAPRAALAALAEWLHAGGTLIASAPQAPRLLDEDGAPYAPADDEAARLAALLAPAGPLDFAALLPDDAIVVHPGDGAARLLLGPGWHGREDGRWAFPALTAAALPGDGRGPAPLDYWTEAEEPPLPCRWTSACSELLVPVPPAARRRPQEFELVLELCVPPAAPHAPLRLQLDGEALEEVVQRGAQRVTRPLPAAPSGDLVVLRLDAPAHRPDRDWGSADRRELGVLVRSVVIAPRAGGREAGLPALLDGQRALRARGAVVRVGRGAVLRGDGTPLAALGLLNAWLAGQIADAPPPPDPPRDVLQGCLVTALEGGLLLHNPHPVSAARPQITGSVPHATRRRSVWNSLRPWSMLAPLQTRFVV
jgi:Beta-galactosidase